MLSGDGESALGAIAEESELPNGGALVSAEEEESASPTGAPNIAAAPVDAAPGPGEELGGGAAESTGESEEVI